MQKHQTTIGRILLALVFLGPVILLLYNIMTNADAYIQYKVALGNVGLGSIFAPLLILVKLVAGAGLLFGYQTKVCAYILFILTVFLAIVSGKHDFQSMFIHLGVAGGLLLLAANSQTTDN